MPRRVRWELKAADVEALEAVEMVAQMPAFDIDKSQTMACTMCEDAEHKMRYRACYCAAPRHAATRAMSNALGAAR
jgi:hypothetical protein